MLLSKVTLDTGDNLIVSKGQGKGKFARVKYTICNIISRKSKGSSYYSSLIQATYY